MDAPARAVDRAPGHRPAGRLYPVVRRVLWDGVDALSLTRSEAQAFLDRLVGRGELTADEARRLLRELPVADGQNPSAEALLERQIRALLERWKVPTRDEIDALSGQVAALADRIERLRRLYLEKETT